MTEEQAMEKLRTHPEIKYVIFGYGVEDGNFKFDCAVCISREDARHESKKFMKFILYDVGKSKNQNL